MRVLTRILMNPTRERRLEKNNGQVEPHLHEKRQQEHRYGYTSSHVRCRVVPDHLQLYMSLEVGSTKSYWHPHFRTLSVRKCRSARSAWEVLRAPISTFQLRNRIYIVAPYLSFSFFQKLKRGACMVWGPRSGTRHSPRCAAGMDRDRGTHPRRPRCTLFDAVRAADASTRPGRGRN